MLMDRNYNLKLSDFGFARGQLRTASGQIIFSETFCGSYAYASPEILKGIPYQPQQSDVWSIGVVLYAMVFGRLPFDDTNFSTLLKQVSNRVTFPKEPRVSNECKHLILKILAPIKLRINIQEILTEPWCLMDSAESPTTSTPTTEQSRTLTVSLLLVTLCGYPFGQSTVGYFLL